MLEIDCNANPRVHEEMSFTHREESKLGSVRLERRADDLFINGKKVFCCPTRFQANPLLSATENQGEFMGCLAKEVYGGDFVPLNACLRDALLEHPEYIPRYLQDKAVYFLGTLFSLRKFLERQAEEFNRPELKKLPGIPYFGFLSYDRDAWRASESSPWVGFPENATALAIQK